MRSLPVIALGLLVLSGCTSYFVHDKKMYAVTPGGAFVRYVPYSEEFVPADKALFPEVARHGRSYNGFSEAVIELHRQETHHLLTGEPYRRPRF